MLSILTQHGYVQICVGSCDFTNPQGVPKESLGQARLADLKKKWLCHKNSQIALKKAKNTRFEKRSSAAHFKNCSVQICIEFEISQKALRGPISN